MLADSQCTPSEADTFGSLRSLADGSGRAHLQFPIPRVLFQSDAGCRLLQTYIPATLHMTVRTQLLLTTKLASDSGNYSLEFWNLFLQSIPSKVYQQWLVITEDKDLPNGYFYLSQCLCFYWTPALKVSEKLCISVKLCKYLSKQLQDT